MRKLKFLVVGVGNIGAEWDIPLDRSFPKTHCGAICMHKEAELAGIVDINRKQLKRVSRYFNVRGFQNIDEALCYKDYDIAVISAPESARLVLIEKLSKHVRGIICEKPMAATLTEAKKICEVIKKSGILFTVDFTRRWYRSFHKLKNLIDKKIIGDIQNVIEMYLYDSKGAGSHQTDLNRFLFGEAEWLQDLARVNGSFDCIVKHKKAVITYVGFSQRFYTMGETIIWGTKGRINVINGGEEFKIFSKRPNRQYKNYYVLYPDNRFKIQSDYKKAMYNLVDNMIDAVKNRNKLLATETDGYRSLELLVSMKKAAHYGRKVLLWEKERL